MYILSYIVDDSWKMQIVAFIGIVFCSIGLLMYDIYKYIYIYLYIYIYMGVCVCVLMRVMTENHLSCYERLFVASMHGNIFC